MMMIDSGREIGAELEGTPSRRPGVLRFQAQSAAAICFSRIVCVTNEYPIFNILNGAGGVGSQGGVINTVFDFI